LQPTLIAETFLALKLNEIDIPAVVNSAILAVERKTLVPQRGLDGGFARNYQAHIYQPVCES
jgi:hypothetical protein